MRDDTASGLIAAILVVPPPTNGMTIASEAVLARSSFNPLWVWRVSRRWTKVPWRLERGIRLLAAGCRMALRSTTQGPRPPYFYLVSDSGYGTLYSIIISALAKIRGFRVVLHHHVAVYSNHRRLAQQALKRVAGPSAVHIFLCHSLAEGYMQLYGTVDGRILPNHFFTSSLPAPMRQSPSDGDPRAPTIGFLSNITVAKGIREVVSLAGMLQEQVPDLHLTLAGPLLEDAATAAVDEYSSQPGAFVTTLGSVDPEQKAAFFSSIDLFVFPTQYPNEAYPLVILEALFYGVPVLTINRGCIGGMVPRDAGLVAENREDFLDDGTRWAANFFRDPAARQRAREAAEEAGETIRDAASTWGGLQAVIRRDSQDLPDRSLGKPLE